MSRIDPARFRTTPNHADTASNLTTMLIDLERTVTAGERIGVVQREHVATTIDAAVAELGSCCGRGSRLPCSEALLKRYNTHGGLIRVLNEIKADLDKGLHWIDFDECIAMVHKLDTCRSDRAAY